MAMLTVRNLPDDVHRALRVRAALHGHSTEAEVREILASAVKPETRVRLGDALAALGESFFGLNSDFNLGVFHVFGTGSGDQLNTMFIPQNQSGELRVAHPSFAADIEAGDDRIGKATLRTVTASLSGLSSNRDLWVFTSSTAPVAIIRNEELILIDAEANIQARI